MPVNKPPLDTVLNNWRNRASAYAQIGLPQSSWYQIAINDVQNVANTGAAPLTTPEVNAAMSAQYANHSLIGNPTPHHHSLLGDIGEVVTSIPKDIGGIITGFLPGAAHLIAHLPSEVTNTFDMLSHIGDDAWLQQHGYETGSIGADVRDIAKSPLLSLIPGVADVADLTSSKGRQFLLSHPVTAALDVLPAGKLAGLGARAAVDAGEAGSALEALQAGNPFRAGARGLREASAKVPGLAGKRITQQEFYQAIADRLGLSRNMREVFRGHTVNGRDAANHAEDFISAIGDEILGMKQEEAQQFWSENYGLSPIADPRHHAMFERLYDLQAIQKELGSARARQTKNKDGTLTLPHGEGSMTFAASSAAAKQHRAIAMLQRSLTRASKDMAREIGKIRKYSTDPRLGDPRRLPSIRTNLAKARVRYMAHQARFNDLRARIDAGQAKFMDLVYESGGPAAIHPRVVHDIRGQAKTAVEAQTHANLRLARQHARLQIQRHGTGATRDALATYRDRQVHALSLLQNTLRSIDTADHFTQIEAALEGQYHMRPRDSKESKAAYARYQKATTSFAHQRGKELYQSIRTDVIRNVLDLVHKGFDPIWVKHVEPGREPLAITTNPLPDHVFDIKQFNEKVMNFSAQVHNVGIGLTAAAIEYWRGIATEHFIRDFVMNHLERTSTLREQYLELAQQSHIARGRPAGYSISAHAQALMNEEWEPIQPQAFGLNGWPMHGRLSNAKQLMIRKDFASTLRGLAPPDTATGLNRLRLHGTYDKVLRVFRFSVLTGPRHMVHVGMGGFLSLFLREPLAAGYTLTHLHSLYRFVADKESPVDLRKHLYDFTPDQILHKAIGAQQGHWLRQGWEKTGAKLEQRLGRFEEMISDMYRASVLLAHPGLDREEAIARANKVMVDMDDMAPWERTIFKQVFPFYGFTRFLFRYLLTYPVDHPYRVAMLTRFAAQEQEDWNSLIPLKFMQTLFIGHPDAHGNIKTVDLRNLNPFRSFANDFTFVGFFQSLNPLLSAPFAARGFDTLTGVGPLYPQLEFNPNSGSLQAAPPTGKDELFNVLSQFIPEIGSLDHFLNITDRMKVLKRTSPAAYKAALYSQLNLPGILSPPITLNLPYVEEKGEMSRYKAATQAVSEFERGQPGGQQAIESFQLVPYQGQYITPQQLEAIWASLRAQSGGINPRAVTATPVHRTSQDPLELLTSLGYIPPAPDNRGL